MDNPAKKLKKSIVSSVMGVLTIMAIVSVLFCTNAMAAADSTQEEAQVETSVEKEQIKWLLYAAIIRGRSTSFGSIAR